MIQERTHKSMSQRGFLLIIMAAVVAVIIVAAVLITTGVIETPRDSAGINNCEKIQKRCEDSCDNKIDCKNDCYSAYQRCREEE